MGPRVTKRVKTAPSKDAMTVNVPAELAKRIRSDAGERGISNTVWFVGVAEAYFNGGFTRMQAPPTDYAIRRQAMCELEPGAAVINKTTRRQFKFMAYFEHEVWVRLKSSSDDYADVTLSLRPFIKHYAERSTT